MKVLKKHVIKSCIIKKLLILKFYKNKIYNFKLNNIIKILKLIFKYHLKNKKIIFLSLDIRIKTFYKLLLMFKNYSCIPSNIWLNGLFTNLSLLKFIYTIIVRIVVNTSIILGSNVTSL